MSCYILKNLMEVYPVSSIFQVLLVILVIEAVLLAVLYFLGRKLEKRQMEQQQLLEASKQVVSMLVIDKKKLKIKESGLPKMVYEQTPKYMRWAKVPVVKAKVGPKVMTLMADAARLPGSPRENGGQGRDQRTVHHRSQERPRRDPGTAGEEAGHVRQAESQAPEGSEVRSPTAAAAKTQQVFRISRAQKPRSAPALFLSWVRFL